MSTLIDEGRPAPVFSLPGRDGSRVRLFSLRECVSSGPALLAFVPETAGENGRGPSRVAAALSWFELIEGVTPLVVTDDHFAAPRNSDRGAEPTAPLLGDGDATVGPTYGVRYEGESVVVYLVDEDRTVRSRWRTDVFDELDLTAVKEAAKRAVNPKPSVNS